jgi:diguanylate cyclase (GGDEF)-like protein
MKILNIEKKSESFKYFVLITIIPILGVIVMFSYAFFHFQQDLDFISHKKRGLKVITEIQKTIFNIQKIRSMVCIKNPNKNSIKNIEIIEEKISKNLLSLKKSLQPIKNGASLKSDLLNFINSVQNSSLQDSNFEYLSNIISEFMMFSNRMSYHYELILDSKLNSFILIDNIIYTLPQLIEHNEQIKAVASNTKDKNLTFNQKEYIAIQLNKIKEKLNKLDFEMFLLYKKTQYNELKIYYKKIKEAQNSVISFTKEDLLNREKLSLEYDKNFTLITKNMDLIINLYNTNLNILNRDLENRLKEIKQLSTYVVIAGLASILFIVYINRFFYSRNRRFINKIQELTITDSMTSLYNRRYFDEVFENNLRIQKRTNQTLIFIILDIDFFKQYNDTYGHQAGDLILKKVAKSLKESLKRAGDMAFRLGGEEFGILSIGMNASEALLFADNIRKKIENAKIEHKKSIVSDYLTISMGLIIIEPSSINDANEVYKCADEALYRAKENGRNQVVIYDTKSFCRI